MAVALVQFKVATGNSTTPSATFDAAPTAGNSLIYGLRATGLWSGVTVPAGPFLDGNHDDDDGGTFNISIGYKAQIAAGHTSTITATATTGQWELVIYEFSGVAATPLDKNPTPTDPSGATHTTIQPGSTGTLTQADEVAVTLAGQGNSNGGSETIDSSFTKVGGTARSVQGYKITTVTTALNPNIGWTTARAANAAIATFKAAAITTGTAVCNLTTSRTAVGTPTVLATAAITETVTATAVATRTVTGTAASNITASRTAVGTRTVLATASQSVTASLGAAGTPTVLGVAGRTITATLTASGLPTVVGVAARTITATRVAVGTRTVYGTASRTITATTTAVGSSTAIVTGTASRTVTVTITAVGTGFTPLVPHVGIVTTGSAGPLAVTADASPLALSADAAPLTTSGRAGP